MHGGSRACDSVRQVQPESGIQTMGATHSTLVMALWPGGEGALVRGAMLVLAGALLLGVSARVQVPFWPVPMTMQTLVVVVLGTALGPGLAALAVLAYLAMGVAGLPVLASTSHGGLAYLAGPTGGYLVGFLLAAVVLGRLAELGLDRSTTGMLAAAAIGHAVILACGWAWLATHLGPAKAWTAGVAPFYLATALKSAMAALLVPAVWRAVEG